MRKGDVRKQEILNTAEELFCRNGYEQTSVQDIIDRLHSSKGSFYHHFTSKESLLEGICENRAKQILDRTMADACKTDRSVLKLDILFSGMVPFKEEKLRFLMMLLPVFSKPEGRMVKQYYCDTLADLFYAPVFRQIETVQEKGELKCDYPDYAAALSLSIINKLWVRICDMIIENEISHKEQDMTEYFRLIECSRICIERFLLLPYGSVTLTDLPALRFMIEQIHTHWNS